LVSRRRCSPLHGGAGMLAAVKDRGSTRPCAATTFAVQIPLPRRRLRRTRIRLLISLAATVSCASGRVTPAPVANAVKLPVPIISQATSHSCGAAALMAALVYFGVFDGPESGLHSSLGVTPAEGTHPDRIVAVARDHGLSAEKRTGLSLLDIQRALDSGALVILDIQAWPERASPDAPFAWETAWDDGHYVVAVGLDAQQLYVMDPSISGSYGFIPREELLRRWHDFEMERGHRVEYRQMGIILRGQPRFGRFPEAPVRVE
jgi:predicted double-glycine peptidase